MKNLFFTACTAFLFIACDKVKMDVKTEKTEEWKPIDSATANKAWMEYATPGDMQKMLAKSNGVWTGANTTWMENGAKPITSTSEATNKMIFDGRYQVSEHKGNFMGMPFEGMSVTGYDNAKKKFVSNWIDNMGTGIMNMEGEWNPSTKSIEFNGKMTDPARPGKDCEVREVYTFVDDNTQKMEMYGPDGKTGKEFKTMEIIFTRKK
ncbi:DUF1579 domain-containing protein [Chryseobacterium sp. S-02]|uniref:DUF1579 domain-containing protein n=1 Tax=Chryseobacterium sp. S-02 TaxID=3404064 RepID=UPI003CFB668D